MDDGFSATFMKIELKSLDYGRSEVQLIILSSSMLVQIIFVKTTFQMLDQLSFSAIAEMFTSNLESYLQRL